MSRYDSRWAAYVQKACNCRRGYMCPFCRRWLAPDTRTAKDRNRAPKAVRAPVQDSPP